jgi:hypothetical protein
MVETPDDGGIGFIPCPWRFEMEYLANKAPRRWDIIQSDAFSPSLKIGQNPGRRMVVLLPGLAVEIENLTPQIGWNNSFPPYTSF